jgi:tripartite-type tricarboxylate transporter receptor subunit TctC
MTPHFSRRQVLGAALSGAAAVALPSWAQTAWPTRPVNLVVPFPAGGGTDAFARPIAAQFQRVTGRTLVIDNKGGAGGTLGAGVAARAAPDGYNFFMGAVHHTIAPSMYPRLDYDLERDLVPLILVASVPQVVVVNPRKIAATRFQDFLAELRARPGKFNYGSAGSGTSHHLAGELFKQQTRTFITHIPYRGAGPALQGLIAGDVDMMFDGLGSSAAHIQGGRIRALMVSGKERNPALPEVPSAGELGLPDYNVTTWYGIWAPRGTPAEAQAAAIEAIRQSVRAEEARAVWARQGASFPDLTGDQFGAFIRGEIRQWSEVVKASGAKLD